MCEKSLAFSLPAVIASLFALPLDAQQPTSAPAPKPKGLQWEVGDYKVKLGGYVKVDLIHDFDEIGSRDSFDPRTIPTTGDSEPGDATRIHARQTRLNLDVRGPSSAGPFRVFVEGDFFGDGNAFRLRHAYGTTGPVLGGQTWTTFMDEEALPETIDFETPIAHPLIRQGQIRFTHSCEGGSYAAIALEDPDSDVLPPTGVPGEVEEPLPDLNARLHWKNEIGHVQLGLFGGMARFDPDVGSPADALLWGVNLSTKIRTVGSDNAIVQISYGDGIGRYRGGTTAAFDANGHLDAVPLFAAMGSYQHHWSEEYRSTLVYSWGKGDLPAGAPATTTEEVSYLAANLIWQFSDRAWAGIEYLYGTRGTYDNADGDAHRVQLAVRFDL
jgi:hypothetical protein